MANPIKISNSTFSLMQEQGFNPSITLSTQDRYHEYFRQEDGTKIHCVDRNFQTLQDIEQKIKSTKEHPLREKLIAFCATFIMVAIVVATALGIYFLATQLGAKGAIGYQMLIGIGAVGLLMGAGGLFVYKWHKELGYRMKCYEKVLNSQYIGLFSVPVFGFLAPFVAQYKRMELLETMRKEASQNYETSKKFAKDYLDQKGTAIHKQFSQTLVNIEDSIKVQKDSSMGSYHYEAMKKRYETAIQELDETQKALT